MAHIVHEHLQALQGAGEAGEPLVAQGSQGHLYLRVAHLRRRAEGALQGGLCPAHGVPQRYYDGFAAADYRLGAGGGGYGANFRHFEQVLHFVGNRAEAVAQLLAYLRQFAPLGQSGKALVDRQARGQVFDVILGDAGVQGQLDSRRLFPF